MPLASGSTNTIVSNSFPEYWSELRPLLWTRWAISVPRTWTSSTPHNHEWVNEAQLMHQHNTTLHMVCPSARSTTMSEMRYYCPQAPNNMEDSMASGTGYSELHNHSRVRHIAPLSKRDSKQYSQCPDQPRCALGWHWNEARERQQPKQEGI